MKYVVTYTGLLWLALPLGGALVVLIAGLLRRQRRRAADVPQSADTPGSAASADEHDNVRNVRGFMLSEFDAMPPADISLVDEVVDPPERAYARGGSRRRPLRRARPSSARRRAMSTHIMA